MRVFVSLTAVTALLGAFSGDAAAQRPGPAGFGQPSVNPYKRPTTSPYLNLLRDGGRNMGLNYYRLVRPEQEFRQQNLQQFRAIESLNRQQEQLGQGVQTLWSQLGPTGHPTAFQSYGGYFGGGVGGRSATLGRGAARRPPR